MGRTLAALGFAMAALLPVAAQATEVPLEIKVIHAKKGKDSVDSALKGLVKDFKGLPFNSYSLLDEATFKIEIDSTGRMQLPSKAWMALRPKELRGKDLRLDIEIKELKFKTTVVVPEGKTIAVGGPRYDGGHMILAVTRQKPKN
ncbi:MAG: hypothetical protein AAFQ82_13495 [Myxococcota bacterium]